MITQTWITQYPLTVIDMKTSCAQYLLYNYEETHSTDPILASDMCFPLSSMLVRCCKLLERLVVDDCGCAQYLLYARKRISLTLWPVICVSSMLASRMTLYILGNDNVFLPVIDAFQTLRLVVNDAECFFVCEETHIASGN